MPTTSHSAREWRRRNMERSSDGSMRVRGCFQRSSDSSGSQEVTAAFRAVDQVTGEAFVYEVRWASSDSRAQVIQRNEGLGFPIHSYGQWAGAAGRAGYVTHAVVNNQVLIACPGLPTLWAPRPGAALVEAEPGDSVSSALTTLPIPRGSVVAWNGRAVMTDGAFLYFSDVALPRAFVANNEYAFTTGAILDIHVGASGDLFVVTESAIFALSRFAGLRGQIVTRQAFTKVVDFPAFHRGQTAVAHGRLWALTRRGLRVVDTPESGAEIPLSDPPFGVPGKRMHRANWADGACRLFGTPEGLVVAAPDGLAHLDLEAEELSWWVPGSGLADNSIGPDPYRVMGVFHDGLGATWYALKNNELVRAVGQTDAANSENGLTLRGGFVGSHRSENPAGLRMLRTSHVEVAGAEKSFVALNGTVSEVNAVDEGPVIGTATWAGTDAIPAVRLQMHTHGHGPLVDRQARGNEIHYYFGATGSGSRVRLEYATFSDDRQGRDGVRNTGS